MREQTIIRRDNSLRSRRRKRLARARFVLFVAIGYLVGRLSFDDVTQGFTLLVGVLVGTIVGAMVTALILIDD